MSVNNGWQFKEMEKMTHIMLDLETLSNAPDAAIVAIGAVRFDPLSGAVWDKSAPAAGGTFYKVINATSTQRAGGRIDAATVMWWLQQSDEARLALTGDDSQPIEKGLQDFGDWFREIPCKGLWGNGADFDNVCLKGAYERLGRTAPWSYKINRCYRTVKAMSPQHELERQGTYHNALDDAVAQAQHLCKIVKELKINI